MLLAWFWSAAQNHKYLIVSLIWGLVLQFSSGGDHKDQGRLSHFHGSKQPVDNSSVYADSAINWFFDRRRAVMVWPKSFGAGKTPRS
jgi:hypothetical protein